MDVCLKKKFSSKSKPSRNSRLWPAEPESLETAYRKGGIDQSSYREMKCGIEKSLPVNCLEEDVVTVADWSDALRLRMHTGTVGHLSVGILLPIVAILSLTQDF